MAVAAVCVLAASAAAAPEARTYRNAGLSVRVPAGWHVVHRRLANCIDPAQRLALTGRGSIIVIQESLNPGRYLRRFPRRPTRFRVEGRPSPLECCAVSGRAGWMLHFRDAGRAFYAYVYPAARGPGHRVRALRILDSLRVRPR